MVLKPLTEEDDWERHGRKYYCKGLVNLLKTDKGPEFILPDEIKEDMEEYEKLCFEKKLDYFKKDVQKYREARSWFLNSL